MSDETEEWKKRWAVELRCRDCGATFECLSPALSLERVHGFNRMFVAGGPEVCPKCKNLKTVPLPPVRRDKPATPDLDSRLPAGRSPSRGTRRSGPGQGAPRRK